MWKHRGCVKATECSYLGPQLIGHEADVASPGHFQLRRNYTQQKIKRSMLDRPGMSNLLISSRTDVDLQRFGAGLELVGQRDVVTEQAVLQHRLADDSS